MVPRPRCAKGQEASAIVRALLKCGRLTFSQLHAETGIMSRTLAETLRDLEREGMVGDEFAGRSFPRRRFYRLAGL